MIRLAPFLPVPYALSLYGFCTSWTAGAVAGVLVLFLQLAYAWVTAPLHTRSPEAWSKACAKADREFAAFLLICLTFGQVFALSP